MIFPAGDASQTVRVTVAPVYEARARDQLADAEVFLTPALCLHWARTFCCMARRPGHGERENQIHRDHEAAKGQQRCGDVRPGKVVVGDRQADTNVAHAAADGQYLAISNFRSTQQPTYDPRGNYQDDNGFDPISTH